MRHAWETCPRSRPDRSHLTGGTGREPIEELCARRRWTPMHGDAVRPCGDQLPSARSRCILERREQSSEAEQKAVPGRLRAHTEQTPPHDTQPDPGPRSPPERSLRSTAARPRRDPQRHDITHAPATPRRPRSDTSTIALSRANRRQDDPRRRSRRVARPATLQSSPTPRRSRPRRARSSRARLRGGRRRGGRGGG